MHIDFFLYLLKEILSFLRERNKDPKSEENASKLNPITFGEPPLSTGNGYA